MLVSATVLREFLELLEIFAPYKDALYVEGGPDTGLSFEIHGTLRGWQGLDLEAMCDQGWGASSHGLSPPEPQLENGEDGDDIIAGGIAALQDQLGGP